MSCSRASLKIPARLAVASIRPGFAGSAGMRSMSPPRLRMWMASCFCRGTSARSGRAGPRLRRRFTPRPTPSPSSGASAAGTAAPAFRPGITPSAADRAPGTGTGRGAARRRRRSAPCSRRPPCEARGPARARLPGLRRGARPARQRHLLLAGVQGPDRVRPALRRGRRAASRPDLSRVRRRLRRLDAEAGLLLAAVPVAERGAPAAAPAVLARKRGRDGGCDAGCVRIAASDPGRF